MNDISKYLVSRFIIAGVKSTITNYICIKYLGGTFNYYLLFYCFIF